MGRKYPMPEQKGSITLFFAICFVLITALILTITESARSFSQHFYMQMAMNSAIESLFSQYHRPLFQRYRVLGLEFREDGDLMDEMAAFLEPYLDCEDLFPVEIRRDDISFTDKTLLTEKANLEENILEYMHYGMAGSLIRYGGRGFSEADIIQDLKTAYDSSDEARPTDSLQRDYQLDSRDLQALEDALLSISNLCEEEKAVHGEAEQALGGENPDRFYTRADDFRNALEKHKKAVSSFEQAIDKLKVQVAALRRRYEEEKAALSERTQEILETELSEYESYVSERSDLRERILAMTEQAELLIAQTDATEEAVRDYEDWFWDALSNIDDEDEEDEEEELWRDRRRFYRDTAEDWAGLTLIAWQQEPSRMDKKTKKLLDNVRGLTEGKLLQLVLPEGTAIPAKETIFSGQALPTIGSAASPIDLCLLGEYALHFFYHYHPTEKKQEIPRSGSTQLEVEYLIHGKGSDYENLSETVERLLFLRELMNLTFLYKTPEMRESAKSFVTALLCITGNPALISVLTFFVLGVWAYGQALVDVRTLLSGGRVPLMHTKESFSLSLEGLLQLGNGSRPEPSDGDAAQKGLSYQDYLRVFLYGEGLKSQQTVNRRMAVAMERNLRTVGEDASRPFALKNCLYGTGAIAVVSGRHMLTEQGIVRMAAGSARESRYSFDVKSYYKYGSESQ